MSSVFNPGDVELLFWQTPTDLHTRGPASNQRLQVLAYGEEAETSGFSSSWSLGCVVFGNTHMFVVGSDV